MASSLSAQIFKLNSLARTQNVDPCGWDLLVDTWSTIYLNVDSRIKKRKWSRLVSYFLYLEYIYTHIHICVIDIES